ncbi:MAG: glycosyltransferase [Mucilaginibacter sp.]|uniref:glycosyltransferase n=1 Tax=Mucilaginibacter sp. TaxID=1882438 RepID=UPI0032638420
MPKPETLVILSPGFPVNEADSTCLPPQQVFVRALKQAYPNLNIVVLAFEYPFAKASYQWFGVDVIAFGGKNRNKLFRLFNWIKIWQVLRKLNKQNNVIGLLSFWVDECAFIGHYFGKRYGTKHLSWILGQDARPGNRYFKLIKPKAEQLIALSDFVRNEVYKNYGIMPKHTITTGIDICLFGESPLKRDIDILGAGSLIALKRYDVFIEAVKTIARYIPNVKAVICGKGPEREKLRRLIKQHGLGKNIVLRHELPHAEVLGLMQRSKVFLHTSEYEGFGAVLLEALYAGAQVVSFVKPMDKAVEHLHVVNNFEEMNARVFELLLEKQLDHTPVLVYPIQQVAIDMMSLFSQSDSATASILAAMASDERVSL